MRATCAIVGLPDGPYADACFGLLESLETLLQRDIELAAGLAGES